MTSVCHQTHVKAWDTSSVPVHRSQQMLPCNASYLVYTGIKGIWSLRRSWMDAYDSHLVLSFVGETRLLAISEEDVLDEATIEGFDSDSQTILAAITLHDQLLQVMLGKVDS